MGKTRIKKEVKRLMKTASGNSGGGNDNTVGRISADIGAISLGLPRTKILKKTAPQSSLNLSANFASRINELKKQKKKVTFCQNLIAEELQDQRKSAAGEDAKHYFKVIHPSAIEKRNVNKPHFLNAGVSEKATRASSFIPESEELMSTSTASLRKIIKKNVKVKRIRLKTRKETFKKKMELLKEKKQELLKASQRQQTVIVGDMHPLLQSLPSLPADEEVDTTEMELLNQLKEEEAKKCVPKKTKFSVKKTQKAILDSLKFFEASGVGVTAGLSAN